MQMNTVMIVDDIESNLEILGAILQDTYNVIAMDSSLEAFKKLKDGANPDIILLDLSMPDMDGFQFLNKLNEHRNLSRIPVIFVTNTDDVYSEEKGLELGAVDYIKKPYEPKIIRVKVRNHIELKIYRDNLYEAVAIHTQQLEQRTKELSAAHNAIVMGLALLAESHDKITGAHLIRIRTLTNILGKKIAEWYPEFFSNEMAEITATYSPLHDIGKVSVSDLVLKKTGKLTEEEFNLMKGHSLDGGEILRQITTLLPNEHNQLSVAIEIAECHHERFDGTGYPNKLAGENIPISARIVSVADVYDALRSPRPYKPKFTHEEAVEIIQKGDGRTEPSHFDPVVLRAFAETHEQLRKAYDSNPDPNVLEEGVQ
jgi:putative two-component system response regulator